MFDSLDMKSRSRRCHNLWHVPRSNWMRRESTGAHFTLKLPDSGRTSVGRARFKSPLAHGISPSQSLLIMVAVLVCQPFANGRSQDDARDRPAASLWRPSVTWLQTSSVIDTFAWPTAPGRPSGALRHPDIDEQIASR